MMIILIAVGPVELQVDRNVVLRLPRLIVLVSTEADRPGAWLSGPLGPHHALFPGIGLSRDYERVKVPGNSMKNLLLVSSPGDPRGVRYSHFSVRILPQELGVLAVDRNQRQGPTGT
jgi:hypothetical protein